MDQVWLVLLIVVVYMAVLAAISLVVRRSSRTSEGFASGGRVFPAALIGFLLMSEFIGTSATLGTAQQAYTTGISAAWNVLALAIGFVLFSLFVAKRYKALGENTISGALARTYGEGVRTATSVTMTCALLIVAVAIYASGGAILASLLGIDRTLATILVGVLATIYVVVGGMRSVVYTNLLHAIMKLAAVALLAGIGLSRVGGIDELRAALPPASFSVAGVGWAQIFAWLIAGIGAIFATQYVVQAVTTVRDPERAQRAGFYAAVMLVPFGILAAVVGMVSAVLYPHIDSIDALPALAVDIDPLLTGLVMCGLVGAILGSIAALIIGSATLLLKDFYRPYFNREGDDRKDVVFLRVATFVAGVVPIMLALLAKDVLAVTFLAKSLRAALAVLIVLMFYKPGYGNSKAAMWSIVAALVATTGWFPRRRPVRRRQRLHRRRHPAGDHDGGAPAPTPHGSRGGGMTAATPAGASLRGWLDHLRSRDRLVVARPGVDLRFGVAGIANRMDGRSATLFPQPGGHHVPIVSGLLSDRAWMAEAMGVPQDRLIERYRSACLEPVPSVEVDDPACQQVVRKDVDLTAMLPIPTHNEHDHGAYITAGLLVARRPDTGVQNVSIHRLQVSGSDRLGALLLPRHTLAFFQAQESAGADLPIAVVIGVDPLTLMASQAIVPIDRDELEISGALRGEPLPITRCVTNDVRVPADAEIVLEGRLLARVREPEGPFGEFPQYYGERAERHVVEIDGLTHRESPIYHTIVGGGLEHLLLGGIPREASFLAALRRGFPCVRDLHLSRGGTCRYHLYVQVERPAPGEAKNVILAALGTHYDIKHVTVVDTDVDVHDPTEVEWAVATRFQADHDLVVVSGSQGSKLDPSTADGVGAKMGLDATVPVDAPPMRFTRIAVPGEPELDIEALTAPAPVDWRSHVGATDG